MKKLTQPLLLLMVMGLLSLALSSLAFASDPPTAVSQAESSERADVAQVIREIEEIPGGAISRAAATTSQFAPTGAIMMHEIEPNNTPATANPLGGDSAVVRGYIFPIGDVDVFSFTGQAGDRVYAATMTAFAAGSSTDSTLDLIDTDGVTILETDVNDGSFAASSSSIAGTTLPANGTYYLRVRTTSATATMRPYDLYFQLQSGSPVAETEPNNLIDGGQPLPTAGWVSGAIDPAGDNDVFTFSLNAGDTVFLSLDLDPERDGGTSWNGRLGLGAFGNPLSILVVNDPNTTSPNSEAFFFTVKETGTYYAFIDPSTAGTGNPSWTYHLSVSVFPHVSETANCATYTSADVPVTIPTGPALVTSTLTVPGNPRIADLDVTIVLTHTNMPDLDVVLMAPGGNEVVLFNDRGASAQQQMNLRLDDEAAIPITSFSVMSGMAYQPQTSTRLAWFNGQDAGGDWTLRVYDDLAANGGVLQSWALTICEPPPPPSCPAGYNPVTVFSTNFEANDGGFTTSGTAVDWAWGSPTAVPITSCNSGSNCWVTNLTGDYSPSSNQNLLSPNVNLSGLFGPIMLTWAQKHQIESANWDNAFIDVQQVGGGSPQRVWEWRDAMLRTGVGSPAVITQPSAGWGMQSADISGFAGQQIELLFNLSSDTSVNFAGLAIDDVTITACAPPAGTPIISLNKTVGADSSVCAAGSAISIGPGDEVTYCYEVTNTGTLTLTLHSLEDDQLGSLLNNFPYSLSPGDSAFITTTVALTETTTNMATWTAFNAGPTNVVTATDSATVTVVPPSISLNKTVGTDSSVCATTNAITVLAGTEVVYCYEVTNTGLTTLSLHDLVDSELGTILNGFAYALAPGASAFVTETAVINVNTVNTATWTAYNAGPTNVAAASDTATVNVATPSNGLPLEDFNAGTAGFPPAGWTVINNGGACVWESTQTTGYPNLTGGTGFAMEANSDDCGSGTTMNTEIRTPFFNLTGATSPVLTYRYDYRDLGVADQGTVDISTDGGATWINLATYLVSDRGPKQNIVDLTAYISEPLLQVRFTYFAPGWDWWFQVDDVAVMLASDPEIVVTPANLASSQLTNVVTTLSLNIANVGAAPLIWDINEAPTSCAAPGDISWLSVAPDSGTTAAGDDDTVTVTFDSTGLAVGTYNGLLCVESNDPATPLVVVPVELEVEPQANIDVSPLSLSSVQPPDTTVVQTLTIANTGDALLEWTIEETLPDRLPPTAVRAANEPVFNVPAAVTSPQQCALFENYIGAEPAGYAEFCGGGQIAAAQGNTPHSPTSVGYTLNLRAPNRNLYEFILNDFPGQTLVGPQADNIYALDFDATATTLYALNSTTGALGTISTANGSFTPIVACPAPDAATWTGLSIDPVTNVFYASTAANLYTIDPAICSPTLIGPFGIAGGIMIDIAIGPAGVMYGHDIFTDAIYTINIATGAATLVGLTGYNANFAQGMDFDNEDGTLYIWLYIGTGVNHYGTVNLATGAVTPLASTNPSGEFEGATQTVSGCVPNDYSWLSVNPTAGTTAAGGSSMVNVTFDSTGLAPGTYTGQLCIRSNDPDQGPGNGTNLVVVPVELVVEPFVPAPSISIIKTVGTVDGVCAATSAITVQSGTTVYYCYTVTNTGNVTLNLHDLDDDVLGDIFTGFVYALTPGSSVNTVAAGLSIPATITQTTTNMATWTAYNAGPVDVATATASATVTVIVYKLYLPIIVKP